MDHPASEAGNNLRGKHTMSTATLNLDAMIDSPANTGPVRVAFVTPEDVSVDASQAREFDSLEEAAISFHSFGAQNHLNDPDGAVGIVWIGEGTAMSELELRFDGRGTVFFEN